MGRAAVTSAVGRQERGISSRQRRGGREERTRRISVQQGRGRVFAPAAGSRGGSEKAEVLLLLRLCKRERLRKMSVRGVCPCPRLHSVSVCP